MNRAVKLKARTKGLPAPEHFELVAMPIPQTSAKDALIRNHYFLVSASLRAMVSEGADDVPGVPFPALMPGDALRGEAIGEVVTAPNDSGLFPGDMVTHFMGWRDYAAVPVTQCQRVTKALPEPAGYAGYLGHGWTAYAAMTRGVQLRPKDTVFVSSAAGAIGSMAGQIARRLGAGRVIGSTSSQEKANWLVKELGYDAAIIRNSHKPLTQQLAEAAPEGIDVFVDNVGGEQLQAAVANARTGARFVILGTLSGQLAEEGTGRTAPVELDTVQILLKHITIRGYSADENPETKQEWFDRLPQWLESGDIVLPRTVIDGLEKATDALCDTARGRYHGMVLVKP